VLAAVLLNGGHGIFASQAGILDGSFEGRQVLDFMPHSRFIEPRDGPQLLRDGSGSAP